MAWTVVSPLARGADRVVADAVLARPNSRLEVVTPFSLVEYRKDFESAHDHAEFERLLGRAARFHELDGCPRHATSKADRAMAYLRVGKRVVDACEIVVAIWNGRRAAGVGGTADIVQYAIEHDRIVLWNRLRPAGPAAQNRSILRWRRRRGRSAADGQGAVARICAASLLLH